MLLPSIHADLVVPVTDANVQNGLSPYNWVRKSDCLFTMVNGASVTLKFNGTRNVTLLVDIDQIKDAGNPDLDCPVIAWSVNGGELKFHQLNPEEKLVTLSADVADPIIDLYVKGMSPFGNRYQGDVPANSLKITGFEVDQGCITTPVTFPSKVWLNIGDSIMSGDGAAYAPGQGRPKNNAWAASNDGRASYGYLLAKHYGFRESRIAYGGYQWAGGSVPKLSELIDQQTSTISRLQKGKLVPAPDVVLINLGENAAPKDEIVIESLSKLRSRVTASTKIIVMIPVSGKARAEVTRAFDKYKTSANDNSAFLIDLGQGLQYTTCDGQHPEAKGHETIFKAALPYFDALFAGAELPRPIQPQTRSLQGIVPVSDKSLVFKKAGDASLEMKIHYPPDWQEGGKKLPAIVFFFGGGWYGGDIGQFRVLGPYLAQRGMIVVTPEYRTINKHGVTPDQCLVDAKSAMRYVRKNAAKLGIDETRIAAGGISAGGHLAAATAFSKGFDAPDDDLQVSCKPAALVLFVPVIDNGPGGFAHGLVKNYWEDFSPMHNIADNPPPTLFMVGDHDQYIPVATARKFKAEMENHGGRCDLKIYENADHAFNFSPQGSKTTTRDMDDFLVSLGYLGVGDHRSDK